MSKLFAATFVLFAATALTTPTLAFVLPEGPLDPQTLVESARLDVEGRLALVSDASLSSDTPADVRVWLLENREELAADVARVEHVWLDASDLDFDPTTCARTYTLVPRSPILFSKGACEDLTSYRAAGELLVRLSVQHFGIVDQEFTTDVARALYELGQ